MAKIPDISPVTRTKQQARITYNRLSRWYDGLAAGSEQPLTKAGLRKLSVQTGERVLEIGCGTGRAYLALAESVGNSGTVFGLDISPGMIAVAKRRIARTHPSHSAAYLLADGAALPFCAASLDAIFMSFTLELFDTSEIPLVLAECRRVLSPGGRICVVAMARDERENLLQRLYEWFHLRLPVSVDCRPIFVQASLDQAGFQIQDVDRKMMWGLPVDICLAGC